MSMQSSKDSAKAVAVFGHTIRKHRDAKGISRARLAQMVSISPKTIQSWENGRTFPENLKVLKAIGKILDIDLGAAFAKAIRMITPLVIKEVAIAKRGRKSLPKKKTKKKAKRRGRSKKKK